jgi:hypothetical protein
MNVPGRTCPLRYRYGPRAIASAPSRQADALYVVGGLYGNLPALEAAEAMVASDPGAVLCFNGDFNWFDIDGDAFETVNLRVLQHDAILGNVEAELGAVGDEAGCGCAYPDSVDAGTVERSNAIHRRLKATAARHPALLERLARLPMVARYQVGGCRVGVVHGDAESLAGWRFDVRALGDPAQRAWLAGVFDSAQVDVFACTHTCLPALRTLEIDRPACVANNGAAGMPNFRGEIHGLVTRVGNRPSPQPALQELRIGGAFVALLPLPYDASRWKAQFLAQWPPGSPAWVSYFDRISAGPRYTREQAFRGALWG